MIDKKNPVTARGLENMYLELSALKSELKDIINDLAIAAQKGDRSDNAELDAAKENHERQQKKIQDLQDLIESSYIVQVDSCVRDKIAFGAKVVVMDVDTDEKSNYTIVGEYEANVRLGYISINAPLSRALIGKKIGDFVETNIHNRIRQYQVLDIAYELLE